jgi:hypothetical protein
MSYPKYTWVGNRISEEDMKRLYELKKANRKPITRMVVEAVKIYLDRHGREILKP